MDFVCLIMNSSSGAYEPQNEKTKQQLKDFRMKGGGPSNPQVETCGSQDGLNMRQSDTGYQEKNFSLKCMWQEKELVRLMMEKNRILGLYNEYIESSRF